MALQMRRGANSDFSPSKMLPGEIAVTTDGTRKVYVAFKSNEVKELVSKEDVQELINGFTSVVDREIAEAEQRIESKAETVLGTIPDDYETLSQKADEAVRTKADAIVCSVSGVNPIAQDSSNDYLRNLKLYGKTTQGENPSPNNQQPLESKGMWGNLVHFADRETTENGITTSIKNGVVTLTGTYTGSSSYVATVYGDDLDLTKLELGKTYYGNIQFKVALSNGTTTYLSKSFVYTEDKLTITPYIQRGTNDYTSGEKIYPVVSEDSSLPYRPYSGQLEIESGVFEKNLLKNHLESHTNNGVDVLINSDKSVALNGKATSTIQLRVWENMPLKKGVAYKLTGGLSSDVMMRFIKKDLSEVYASDTGNGVVYSPSEDMEVLIDIRIANGVSVNTTVYPMIRKAEITDGTYVQYSKQSHISLVNDGLKGIPVTDASLATYTDENGQMICSDVTDYGKQVSVQRIFRDVTDEDTIISEYTSHVISGWKKYKIKTKINTGIYQNKDDVALGYCNAFPVISITKYITQWDNKAIGIAWSKTSGEYYVMVTEEMFPTVEDFEEYVRNNPIEIMGVLATPIETPLTASEIASYKALKSNYKVTSVMNDCGAFVEVQYNADTKTYMDNLINKLQTAIVALGGTL